jgi:hypothetical protein
MAWIVWRGGGCLVAVILLVCLFLTQFVVNLALQDPRFYTTHGWPKLVALWVAAVLVWLYNKKMFTPEELNIPTLTRMEGQPKEKEFLAAQHSLFFINVKYWPPLLFVLGIVLLFI